MKAVVFTLGCKVNFCESSSLINGLHSLGYEVSEKLEYADLYVINTCAVTAEAEKKSRQTVARVKKFNPNADIIITGCASEHSPESFIKKQGVTLVTGTKSKDKILSMLKERGIKIEQKDEYYEEYLPAKTFKERAYVKVQDGCNNFCSYCLIPYLRGRSRSRNYLNVIKEIEYLSPKEVVLTGINLSDYNFDGVNLSGLILKLKGLNCRIRLGSLEVNVITDEFLQATKELKDFAPHFHLSLQSGSDNVLASMNRKYNRDDYLQRAKLIRSYYKDAAITTDIIVGYSTETEEDFNDTLDLVKRVEFSDIHCFPYSKRDGTEGAKLEELPSDVKKSRLDILLKEKQNSKLAYIEKNIGKALFVLPEETEDGYTVGYSENYLRVYLKGNYFGKIFKVKAISPFKDGVLAEIIEE